MRKIILTILSVMCFILGVCFISCDDGVEEPPKVYRYYGVIQTLEGYDGLYMQVPDFGVCELPTYEEGRVPNLALKEGDLVCLYFASEIQVTKSYPAIIATPASGIAVLEENIGFETTDSRYVLTIDCTQEIRNELLAYEKYSGDTVHFVLYEGAPNHERGALRVSDYATATIEAFSIDRLTLAFSLDIDMQEFFELYTSGDLKLRGQSVNGTEQPLVNFFDLRDNLEISDLEKVEIISMAGSVAPELREPTGYKTSTTLEDLQIIYDWLKFLNHANLKEITQSEAFVEGGSSKILTVYTKKGDFKIYEAAGKILTIWDRYFGILGENMPEIEGDSAVLKFDYSVEEKVGFYKWNLFSREYNLKISELSFKKSMRDSGLLRVGYFLKTDVGVIELYSNKIFYHEGTGRYYEIVGEKDFSIIFETNDPLTDKVLQNYELIKSIHAEHCEDPICKSGGSEYYGAIISEYYGEYESGAIVALVYCGAANDAAVAWREIVAGYEFAYGDSNSITVFYNGDCYSLLEAYTNGYLTKEDIGTIATKRKIFEYFSLIS